ncbi:MAG: hypothetical protein QNJ97_00250 [Myxococcota bacterium]|nr:hypothetical protein [Myxococcota bacterium]
MASKATVQRQKSAQKVIAAGRTHKQLITASVAQRYGKDSGPAVDLLVTRITDDLEAKVTDMIQQDDAHEAELRDDPEIRNQRDSVSARIRDRLIETREQLAAICGPTYVAKLGFSGKTPGDPVAVKRLAQTLIANLAAVPAPTPKIPGYQLDPELWRAPLAQLVDQIEGVVSQVATEEREAEATLTAKRAAIATYDEAFSATANLLSTLLSLAGEKDLAKRVRPSTRRSGQTAEDAPNTGSQPFDTSAS